MDLDDVNSFLVEYADEFCYLEHDANYAWEFVHAYGNNTLIYKIDLTDAFIEDLKQNSFLIEGEIEELSYIRRTLFRKAQILTYVSRRLSMERLPELFDLYERHNPSVGQLLRARLTELLKFIG